MKIAFITSTLGSGGSERVLIGYANRLSIKNEILILKFDYDSPFYQVNDSVKILNLGLFSFSSNILTGFLKNIKRVYVLLKTLKSLNPDLIISFQTQTNIVSLIAAKYIGLRIYIFERTNHLYEKSLLWTLLRRWLYPLADKLFVLTSFDSSYYCKFVKKVKKIHNPIFIKVPGKNEFEKKDNTILAVGRFDENKQFELLIKIFANLNKNDYKLLVVGDGPLKDEYEKLIKDYDLIGKTEIIGKTSEIEKFYLKAKIFCLTSKMEGFPNVLIEAMSYGCVPIAFDCITGPSEIINNGVNGFLIKPEDISAFSKKLKFLMSEPDVIRKMSDSAFISSKRFLPEIIMKDIERELN